MDEMEDKDRDEERAKDDFAAALARTLDADCAKKGVAGGWGSGRQGHYVEHAIKPHPLRDISHTHEFIMNWLIANPGKKLGELARVVGYSQSYISILIHSDLFQARLREKQDECFSAIKADLVTKLNALADVGVEKLQEQMETSTDPKFIHEVTKTALAAMGFGAKAATASGPTTNNVQQNIYVASPADLEAARGRMAGQGGPVSSSLPQLPSAPGEATLSSLPSDPIEVLVREQGNG